MKRLAYGFLTLVMVWTLCIPALAADDPEYTLTLLANNSASATVKVGDEVTVTLALSEQNAAAFDLYELQDYICFDAAYLQFVSGSIQTGEGLGLSASPIQFYATGSGDYNRIYMNRYSDHTAVQSGATILTFKLKALKVGSTELTHDAAEIFQELGHLYPLTEQNATITIKAADTTEQNPGTTNKEPGKTEEASGNLEGNSGNKAETAGNTEKVPETTTSTPTTTTSSVAAGGGGGGGGGGASAVATTTISGSVTTTTDQATGTVTEVTTQADGSVIEKVTTATGVVGTLTTNASGAVTQVSAEIPASVGGNHETVTIPVTVAPAKSAASAPVVNIQVEGGRSVKVEIPVTDVRPGVVAILIKPDGTEEIIKTSSISENGVLLTVDGNVEIKLVDNSKTFSDVQEQGWFSDAVEYVSARELMTGTGDGSFSPNVEMSRAMLTQVLYSLEDKPEVGGNDFQDVNSSDWYGNAVSWAVENSIISGVGDGQFAPNASLTREQMAVILYGYAKSKGLDTTTSSSLDDFQDGDSASSWSGTALEWALSAGMISGKGDGILDPTGTSTRAEIATILTGFCKFMAK